MESTFKSRGVDGEVRDYEQVDEKSRVGLGAAGAAAGAVLLGPIGLAGGLLGAKKRRVGIITWTSGEQSIVEIKDKKVHTKLIELAAIGRTTSTSRTVTTKVKVPVDEHGNRVSPSPAPRETKACPFCAEDVLLAAVKCKHCGEFFSDEAT